MKLFPVVCMLAVGTSSCLASFEMMLLPTQDSSTVTRWDPINRVNLGTFGIEGGSNTRSVSLAGQNQAIISNQFFGKNYNYSTGIDSGTIYLSGDTATNTASQTRFMTAGLSSVYLYSTAGSFLGNVSPVMNGIGGITPVTESRGLTFGVVDLTDSLGFSVTNFGNNTSGPLTTLTSGGGFSASRMGTGFTSDAFGYKQVMFSHTFGNTATIYSVYLDPTTYAFVTWGFVSATGFANDTPVNIMAAHDGFWVVGRASSSPTATRFTKFNSGGLLDGSYVTTAVQVPNYKWTGSNVIAPEPGTMLALSAGALALCKRRKRKA
jgi:hypothetical protein